MFRPFATSGLICKSTGTQSEGLNMPQEINNSESTAEKAVEAEIKDAATNIKASEP